MNKAFKTLYDTFYKPRPETKLKQEIESYHQQLIESLSKHQRHLVLRIIDAKDQIAENMSIDSFIYGFKLAWWLGNEISNHR